MSYLPQEWSYGALKIAMFEIYNVLKWESRFTLVLIAAKNIDYIKKLYDKKLLRITILTKNSLNAYLLSTSGVEQGSLRLICLKYYNVLKWESRCTFGLNTATNINYFQKHFK